jgi:ABC-type transport system substrate-binding protein
MSSRLGLGGLAQHLLINTTKPPFNDLTVRLAANHAIDRKAILENVVEGRGELLRGPFSSGWPGFDPSLEPFPYDPNKARQLLAEAGLASGFETELSTSNGVWLKDNLVAETLASQLEVVGIKARVMVKEAGKLLADRLAGTFEGFTLSPWGAGPDADPMIGTHFYKTKLHAPDETLTALIEKTRATLEPNERLKALVEFGRYVHEQAYILETHSVDSFWAARKSINWVPRESGRGSTLLFRLTKQ